MLISSSTGWVTKRLAGDSDIGYLKKAAKEKMQGGLALLTHAANQPEGHSPTLVAIKRCRENLRLSA
jgi:hypothetical protein